MVVVVVVHQSKKHVSLSEGDTDKKHVAGLAFEDHQDGIDGAFEEGGPCCAPAGRARVTDVSRFWVCHSAGGPLFFCVLGCFLSDLLICCCCFSIVSRVCHGLCVHKM